MASGQSILITGAGGFIGQALATLLVQDSDVAKVVLTDVRAPDLPKTVGTDHRKCELESLPADLTQKSTCEELLNADFTHIYLLHGIMSGQAESDHELGLRVNVDSMRNIVDMLRAKKRSDPVKVIFPSSLAVFGPAKEGQTVTEETITLPQSSYGSEKAMVELLLNDLSRRRMIDARILRLPTIIVRPGRPTGAASSFCSGIIREPLNGEAGTLPVKKSMNLWVCSARTVIRNLAAAKDIPEDKFKGYHSRTVNLPGTTTSVTKMLEALGNVGGQNALDLVKEEYDDNVARIVGSWPAFFDTTRAKKLGFQDDVPLEQACKDYITDYVR